MKGADFVWDKEKLDRFIARPDEVVLGNNMKAIWRDHIGAAMSRSRSLKRSPDSYQRGAQSAGITGLPLPMAV